MLISFQILDSAGYQPASAFISVQGGPVAPTSWGPRGSSLPQYLSHGAHPIISKIGAVDANTHKLAALQQ